MSAISPPTRISTTRIDFGATVRQFINRLPIQRGSILVLIIFGALIAFEIFNYGTTEFALGDLLGDLGFAGIRWSTILALAFCSMDFSGIARLFTSERGEHEPIGIWYLLGAWFLAATMNAMLTWWSISLALIGHQGLGNELVGREALLSAVPIFVAILVWLIRVLIIGTFTLNGERLVSLEAVRPPFRVRQPRATPSTKRTGESRRPSRVSRPVRPVPKPIARNEPIYTPQLLSARPTRRQ